ncbi:putative transcriptional regulator [Actinoalloteichus sp. GBA129-24]|nr:putative transcriptional regulator [Actinoalloteichus sp. GBA129-24]
MSRRQAFSQRRKILGYSQESFAVRVGVEFSTVGRWERGELTPQPWRRPRIANALQVPLEELEQLLALEESPMTRDAGARRSRTGDIVVVSGPSSSPRLVFWEASSLVREVLDQSEVDLTVFSRRTVLTTTAGLAGAAFAAALEPVLRPVLTASTPGHAFATAQLVDAEEIVGQLTRLHRRAGGLDVRMVAAQLNAFCRRLREAPQGTPETSRAFRVAAELAELVASMNWDDGLHDSAQRYFLLAVQLAHAANDRVLVAVVLAALARQCSDLGRPKDALEAVQLAQYLTRREATPRLRALLATREGWAHAQQGDAKAFQRCVTAAQDHHAEGVDEDDSHASIIGLDDAELAGVVGARYRDLAAHDVRHARTAQEYIDTALRLRPSDHLRTRTFDLIGLARTHVISREPDRAAELIAEVLPPIPTLAHGRVGRKLREFHREAAVFDDVPAVHDVRQAVIELTTS